MKRSRKLAVLLVPAWMAAQVAASPVTLAAAPGLSHDVVLRWIGGALRLVLAHRSPAGPHAHGAPGAHGPAASPAHLHVHTAGDRAAAGPVSCHERDGDHLIPSGTDPALSAKHHGVMGHASPPAGVAMVVLPPAQPAVRAVLRSARVPRGPSPPGRTTVLLI